MAKKKKKSKLQKKRDNHNSTLWRNKADKAWKELVFIAYDFKCAICGSTEYLQAHHLIPREMVSHRHITENGILLCCGHHKYSFGISPHKAPVTFFKWLINNNKEKWEWLLAQDPSREHSLTYKEIYEQMEKELINKRENIMVNIFESGGGNANGVLRTGEEDSKESSDNASPSATGEQGTNNIQSDQECSKS